MSGQIFPTNRQSTNSFSGGGEYRVAYCGSNRRNSRLAAAGWRFGAGHDVYFHVGHLVDAKHVIIIEITLLHAAAIDGDLALESSRESVHNAALHLSFNRGRIDDAATVDGANHAM